MTSSLDSAPVVIALIVVISIALPILVAAILTRISRASKHKDLPLDQEEFEE